MNKRLSNDKLILLTLFAGVQLFLLLSVGIYTKEEAVKYINEAIYFSEYGHFSEPKYFFYSGYILLHVVNNWIGSGLIGVYICQLFINAIATLCLYSLCINLGLEKRVAFLASFLLIVCLPFQRWTVYLFTESIFFSILIIYSSVLFSRSLSTRNKIFFGLPILFLLMISRPTGLLAVPATLAFASYALIKRQKFGYLALIWIVGLFGLLWVTNVAMSGQGEFDFIKPFVEEHVICGYNNSGIAYHPAPGESNSVQGLLTYILNHFGQFIGLALKRTIAFFGLTRSYFSTRHNLYLELYFYPIYLFSLLGVRVIYQKSKSFLVYSVLLAGAFLFSVILTCDDWHNRFIMPIVPIIMIYASAGIQFTYRSLVSWRRRW